VSKLWLNLHFWVAWLNYIYITIITCNNYFYPLFENADSEACSLGKNWCKLTSSDGILRSVAVGVTLELLLLMLSGWQLIALWALGLPFIINGLCVMAVTSHCFCVTSRKSTQWCIHSHKDSNTPVSQTDLTAFSGFLLVMCGYFQDVRLWCVEAEGMKDAGSKASHTMWKARYFAQKYNVFHKRTHQQLELHKSRAEKDFLIQIQWQRRN